MWKAVGPPSLVDIKQAMNECSGRLKYTKLFHCLFSEILKEFQSFLFVLISGLNAIKGR